MRRAILFLSVVVTVSACTKGAGSPAGFSPSTPSPTIETPTGSVAAVCEDVAKIDRGVPQILSRLRAGTETKTEFQRDVLRIDLLANNLYRDAGAFATTEPEMFAVMNELSSRLLDVITGEDTLEDPAQVDPATVPLAQDALTKADRAIQGGLLSCPTSG